MAIFFMTNLSTILEFMQRRTACGKEIDFAYYQEKMNEYELVFDSVTEEFNNDMFGSFSNSVTRQEF